MDKDKIIEAIKNMSVLELNELVKACEEEFGVSAAAPVAVVGAAGGAAPEEEQTEFNVVLAEIGAEKIKVIYAIAELHAGFQNAYLNTKGHYLRGNKFPLTAWQYL